MTPEHREAARSLIGAKKRKLGIRFKKQQAREWGWTVPATNSAELFDVETGEAFEGVQSINILCGFPAPLSLETPQLRATLEIFVAAVDSYERPE